MHDSSKNRLLMRMSAVLFLGIFALGGAAAPHAAHAATGTFKVSDYGTGQTSGTTSQYYRGYVFRVTQETVIDHLIGGGGSAVYGVGIYTVSTDGTTGSTTPTALIGYANTTVSGAPAAPHCRGLRYSCRRDRVLRGSDQDRACRVSESARHHAGRRLLRREDAGSDERRRSLRPLVVAGRHLSQIGAV